MIVVAVGLLLSLGLIVDASWLPALLLAEGAVVAVLVLDALLCWQRAATLRAEVECARTWSLARPESLVFVIEHRRALRSVRLVPDLPRSCRSDPSEQTIALPSRGRSRVHFRIATSERGRIHVGGVWVAVPSLLGFWRRHRLLAARREVHVYPDLKQLADYALLARADRLNLIGVRRLRRAGGDTDFERLRDYQTGDPLQRVDWKATARRDQLTVRDYQITQSQCVIFVIDTGRMMVTRGSGAGERVSLLDRAIDACLMLAYVALVQGDRVGVVAYGDGISRYVPPRGGSRHLTAIIHALHDLEAGLVESRHDQAFLHVQRHERKRALMVLITNLLDDVNADMVRNHLRGLHRRHLPMAVILRDPEVFAPLRQAVHGEADLWRAGAAADIANWRKRALARLEQEGALVVDAELEDLTPAVVSRYLEVKARHLL